MYSQEEKSVFFGWTTGLTKGSIHSTLNQVVYVSWDTHDRLLLGVGHWWRSIQAGCQEQLWGIRQYQAILITTSMTQRKLPPSQPPTQSQLCESVTLFSQSHCTLNQKFMSWAFMELGLFNMVSSMVRIWHSWLWVPAYSVCKHKVIRCSEMAKVLIRSSRGAVTVSIWSFVHLFKEYLKAFFQIIFLCWPQY